MFGFNEFAGYHPSVYGPDQRSPHPSENPFGGVEYLLGKLKLMVNYQSNRNIAIGTGIPAIAALISLVVFAILFPPGGLAFALGVGISGLALLGLGIPAIIHTAWVIEAEQTVKKWQEANF